MDEALSTRLSRPCSRRCGSPSIIASLSSTGCAPGSLCSPREAGRDRSSTSRGDRLAVQRDRAAVRARDEQQVTGQATDSRSSPPRRDRSVASARPAFASGDSAIRAQSAAMRAGSAARARVRGRTARSRSSDGIGRDEYLVSVVASREISVAAGGTGRRLGSAAVTEAARRAHRSTGRSAAPRARSRRVRRGEERVARRSSSSRSSLWIDSRAARSDRATTTDVAVAVAHGQQAQSPFGLRQRDRFDGPLARQPRGRGLPERSGWSPAVVERITRRSRRRAAERVPRDVPDRRGFAAA